MTLYPGPPIDKRCFVYCGDERCNCLAGPRGRALSEEVALLALGVDLRGRPARDADDPATEDAAALPPAGER